MHFSRWRRAPRPGHVQGALGTDRPPHRTTAMATAGSSVDDGAQHTLDAVKDQRLRGRVELRGCPAAASAGGLTDAPGRVDRGDGGDRGAGGQRPA